MSKLTFANEANHFKHIDGEHLEFLVKEHKVTMDEAMQVMIDIGFEKGLSNNGNDEYWT